MQNSLIRGKTSDFAIYCGLIFVSLFFIGSTVIAYWNTRIIAEQVGRVVQTHQTINALNELLSTLKDAETGQRGFVITGDEKYLQPYRDALPHIDEELAQLDLTFKDMPDQAAKLALIRNNIAQKLAELKETIDLRRNEGFKPAYDVVVTDRGKDYMDRTRNLMQELGQTEMDLRSQRLAQMENAFRLAIVTGVLAGVFGLLLTFIVGVLIKRATANQRRQDWLRSGQAALAVAVTGEMPLHELGDKAVKLLTEYLGAQAGAFFVKQAEVFQRVATYGIAADSRMPQLFRPGDGLLGQAVKDGKPVTIVDMPDDYFYFSSGLGQGKPRHLLIYPLTAETEINAVVELGFIRRINPLALELLEKVAEVIGVAVRSINYRNNLQNLLEETQRQSEELQMQSEELKVSNEELEEQGRALKESQARLEQQQVEMEQTNSQLEEQAQMLETQRDDLEYSRRQVQFKVQELEQASQYKSNFLANMSHELRTPLNSSLILAKLLADNRHGNLTDEQILHARTIQSAGNDLLSLINDILDLSKIEAGHMEIHPDTVSLSRLGKDLSQMFNPLAQEKRLSFKIVTAPDCPETIISDRQRLEQVLKNLIANALKFTEKGGVTLTISPVTGHKLSFAVSDTGIGISADQQAAIFDAFRQADGTISRKYGGTGLGLSISRELTRLLGGRIELSSESGKGSTFSVILPAQYEAGKVQAAQPAVIPAIETAPAIQPPSLSSQTSYRTLADDRDKLREGIRTILIIEDDESFARILYGLAREQDFQCLLAATAEEGLIAAKQYLPHAILLDVGLPDNSGLTVLDRLKHDSRTRHIPVHIISGSDHSQTALALGAVGYMLKPIKREELTKALKRIEERFSRDMRHVLIVEDDKVQRESVGKLLRSYDIQTTAVGTVAECLQRLQEGVYDCMVLDLSLPDASGYSLLETLSAESGYSFPPVIVYTGRDLSADEEQRLRRYAKSVIIKGAKSPERLLDEVTLFLHRMVSELPLEQQRMLEHAKSRDAALEGKRVLIVEDDVRNIYAVTSILEPQGVKVQIARHGREALARLEESLAVPDKRIDLVLMDVMMPEMDGLTATREIRKREEWKKLPVIMLTAKAMKDDQERCLEAGASDYMAKPLDVEKLLSLVRVWMPR